MMNIGYVFELLSKVINYRLARKGWIKPANPVTLTFSVTNMCQSRCKTCKIWKLYIEQPQKQKEELSIDEIELIFKHMGHIYFFNISGGEPYLREDLPQIVQLACRYLTPGIIHIPTNGLTPKRIEQYTLKILQLMEKENWHVPLTVKPSLDGVGKKHDVIRGVDGNFDRVVETTERLNKLSQKYHNLYVEIGTVISKFNMDDIDEIANFVHNTLKIESYRNEVAEQRTEFFNIGDPITPDAQEYARLMNYFMQKIKENIKNKKLFTKLSEALRFVYYEYAAKIMREKRQILPCYAGISNVHLTPYGDLWPCCVLGYDKPMGNLREADYDFKKVWHSKQANEVRRYIREGNCVCPLANQAYSNILCSAVAIFKVINRAVDFILT